MIKGSYKVTTRRKDGTLLSSEVFGCKKISFFGDAALEGNAKPMFFGDVEPKKPAVSKCPACGSHEFRQHNNVRVCSYCRCGQ